MFVNAAHLAGVSGMESLGIVLVPSKGKPIENPSIEQLHSPIFDLGSEYWQKGRGGVSLRVPYGRRRPELSLDFHESGGFVVQHCIRAGNQQGPMNIDHDSSVAVEEFVAVTSHEYSETTSVIVGGDDWCVPMAFILTKEMAWIAVLEFRGSGQKSTELEWVGLHDVAY